MIMKRLFPATHDEHAHGDHRVGDGRFQVGGARVRDPGAFELSVNGGQSPNTSWPSRPLSADATLLIVEGRRCDSRARRGQGVGRSGLRCLSPYLWRATAPMGVCAGAPDPTARRIPRRASAAEVCMCLRHAADRLHALGERGHGRLGSKVVGEVHEAEPAPGQHGADCGLSRSSRRPGRQAGDAWPRSGPRSSPPVR